MSEIYTGTKFETKFLGERFEYIKRTDELIYWGKYLSEHRMAPKYPGGSSGNISFRLSEMGKQFIISATSTDLENLKSDDFVMVENVFLAEKKIVVFGKKEPSSESMLHFSIYAQRPDVMAIFHGHWPDLIALATQFGFVQTKNEQEYGSLALVNEVLEVIDNNNFIIMKNHGFLAMAKSIAQAGEIIQSIKLSTITQLENPDA